MGCVRLLATGRHYVVYALRVASFLKQTSVPLRKIHVEQPHMTNRCE